MSNQRDCLFLALYCLSAALTLTFMLLSNHKRASTAIAMSLACPFGWIVFVIWAAASFVYDFVRGGDE